MNGDDDSGGRPEGERGAALGKPVIMDDALAVALAALPGFSGPDKAARLRQGVEVERAFLIARGIKVPPRLKPAMAERLLARLARSLEQGGCPNAKALADHNARVLLRLASLEARSDRGAAERLIREGDLESALPIVRLAAMKAGKMKAETLEHGPDDLINQVVRRLGNLYESILGTIDNNTLKKFQVDTSKKRSRRGKRATRGDRDYPSAFEIFLEKAIGDLVERMEASGKGEALAKRYERTKALWLEVAARLPPPETRDAPVCLGKEALTTEESH